MQHCRMDLGVEERKGGKYKSRDGTSIWDEVKDLSTRVCRDTNMSKEILLIDPYIC